jgi:site-specific DNA-methyltransferase (adenine-specific)
MEINKVCCGDCIQLMKDLPEDFVDLTITSPPYDNLRDYNGFTFDFENIAKELYRITKEGGVIVWVVSDSTIKGSETGTSFKQALYFKEIGFNLHDTMIWAKTKMPQNHKRYEQGFEYMFVFVKGKLKTFNGLRDKKNTQAGKVAYASFRDKDGVVKKTSSFKKTLIAEFGLRTNVWNNLPVISNNERCGHPAPFSESLVKDHILSWSNKWDLVFDPMCGSGTTLNVAKYNNRNFLGFDVSEEYCEITRKRISQNTLFCEENK